MQIDDPYRELGVAADASDAQVKAAWRRLAARWHPDRNPSRQALQKTQRINLALEAIRAARSTAGAARPAQDEPGAGSDEPAIEHLASVSLEDAACGCVLEVRGEIAAPCAGCAGTGIAAEPVRCTACAGRGQVQQALWFPWLASSVRCTACDGQGAVDATCADCAGTGQAPARRYRSRVRIPPGVRDGQVLQARVRLQDPPGSRPLDLRVALQPHPWFVLAEDGTVRLELPVDGFAWVAQHWVDVPTPQGVRQMRLQRGALTYRIRGAGFPAVTAGAPADCLVSVVPLFPDAWTPQQETLLGALVAANTGDPGTPAGERARAWAQQVAARQAARTRD